MAGGQTSKRWLKYLVHHCWLIASSQKLLIHNNATNVHTTTPEQNFLSLTITVHVPREISSRILFTFFLIWSTSPHNAYTDTLGSWVGHSAVARAKTAVLVAQRASNPQKWGNQPLARLSIAAAASSVKWNRRSIKDRRFPAIRGSELRETTSSLLSPE